MVEKLENIKGCGKSAQHGRWLRVGASNYWADQGEFFTSRPYETSRLEISETNYICGQFATKHSDGWHPLCESCQVKFGYRW